MLVSVIDHIQVYYREYFNFDLHIPKTDFKLAVEEINGQMNLMLSRLKSLSDFMKASHYSYYRLAYVLDFLLQVAACSKKQLKPLINKASLHQSRQLPIC